jgi:hypothetical protein
MKMHGEKVKLVTILFTLRGISFLDGLIIWKFRCIRRGAEIVSYSAPKGKENEIQVLLKFKETQNWWEIFMNQKRLYVNEELQHKKITS